MVARLNLAIKGREGFRPLAPAVLAERVNDWFELAGASPYMLRTAQVRSYRSRHPTEPGLDFAQRLASVRSDVPACTHVDGSARVQTVDPSTEPLFHQLLRTFESKTGCPVLLNTSFNRRDEPIVCTPADALLCFEATDLDLLVLEDNVIERSAFDTWRASTAVPFVAAAGPVA